MTHRKSDTDRRWNKYFALSQLRKRGGKREGQGLRVWRIGGDSAPLPISARPLVRCPSLRGKFPLTLSLFLGALPCSCGSPLLGHPP